MDLALWAAKTGLDAQNTQMAVIANNLANSNTTGFKSDRAARRAPRTPSIRPACRSAPA